MFTKLVYKAQTNFGRHNCEHYIPHPQNRMKSCFYSWSKGEYYSTNIPENNHHHLAFHVEIGHVLISLLMFGDHSVCLPEKHFITCCKLPLNVVRNLECIGSGRHFSSIFLTGHVTSKLMPVVLHHSLYI